MKKPKSLVRLVCCEFKAPAYYCPECGNICSDCWQDVEMQRHFEGSSSLIKNACPLSKIKWGWKKKNGKFYVTPCGDTPRDSGWYHYCVNKKDGRDYD